jgi:hypothetical protein
VVGQVTLPVRVRGGHCPGRTFEQRPDREQVLHQRDRPGVDHLRRLSGGQDRDAVGLDGTARLRANFGHKVFTVPRHHHR